MDDLRGTTDYTPDTYFGWTEDQARYEQIAERAVQRVDDVAHNSEPAQWDCIPGVVFDYSTGYVGKPLKATYVEVGRLLERFSLHELERKTIALTDMGAGRIAQAKKSSKPRSESPFTQQPVSLFGQTLPPQPYRPEPTGNPFMPSNISFAFGQSQQQQQQQPNGSATPTTSFQFGANPPSNPFSQSSAPSFGSTPSTQPQQNGFNPSTSMFSTQTSQQSTNTGFGGGFGQSQTTQQNGTSTPATSFGGFPSQTQSSTQQNGNGNPFGGLSFNKPADTTEQPSTSNIFGGFGQQNGEKASSPFPSFGQQSTQGEREKSGTPFSGFGQQTTQAEREKSATPFIGFGQQNVQAQQSKETTPFVGFGQQKSQEEREKSSTPFSGFGQSQEQDKSDKTPSLFANFGAKAPESSNKQTNGFSLGQPPTQDAAKASTLFGQKAAETPATAPTTASSVFAGFGQTNPEASTNKSLFAPSEPTKEISNDAPQLEGNVFSQSTPSNAPGTGLFGAKINSNPPATSSGSIFDQLPKKDASVGKFVFDSSDPSQVYKAGDDDEDGQDDVQQNVEPTVAAQAGKPNLFGTLGQSQSTLQTSKPASNLFRQEQASTSLFEQSTSQQQDTSTVTPSATPQKPVFQHSTFAMTPAAATTPAAQPPRSLFSRIDQDDVNKRLDTQADDTPKASMFATTTPAPATTAKPAFTPSTPSLFQKPPPTPQAEQTPKASANTNLFSQSSSVPVDRNVFSQPTAAAPPTAPTPTSQAPQATASADRPIGAPSGAPASRSHTAVVSTDLSAAQKKSLKELNEGLLSHLKTQDPAKDWSAIYRYALVAAAEIAGRSKPAEDETHPVPPPSAPSSSNMLASASTPAHVFTNHPPSASNAQTPKAAPTSHILANPPATAPTNKKRHFEDDGENSARAPATEKRVKPNKPKIAQYPKLPETASNTAKLFASTLDKPTSAETPQAAATPAFNPSDKSLFSGPPTTAAATSSAGGSNPTLGAVPSTTGPAMGGFKPTGASATGPNNFLSAFGNLAKKTEDAERKRRKAEEYDSDEETEEQWEKRDRAKQEAKRAELEDAAKTAGGFTLKAPTAATAEKAQGAGDKTWKPETPIKFNFGAPSSDATTTPAGAPPKFGLFGAASSSNDTSKLTPGSALRFSTTPGGDDDDDSRAPTPGAATDGEASKTAGEDAAAEGEPSDEQTDAQADDMNGLQAAERESNDILAELSHVKAQINEFDESKGKKVWKPKTEGDVYLLKDKATGKTRMLCRAGAGRIVLNHNPNKGAAFTQHSKKPTMVVASLLYDHLHTNPPSLAQWIFTFKSAEDAATFARVMGEGTPK